MPDDGEFLGRPRADEIDGDADPDFQKDRSESHDGEAVDEEAFDDEDIETIFETSFDDDEE